MNTQLHIGKVAALALIILLPSGCYRGIDFSPRPTNKPNVSDLRGEWAPDKATLKDMAERGGYDTKLQTKLILHDNGNFELVNMPDWWESSFGESQRKLRSYSGDWEIAKDGEYWELALYYSSIQTRFSLFEIKPPYKIGVVLGDPDSGDVMIFVKQGSE